MTLVRIEGSGLVAELVLDRPEKLNAFSPELFADFAAALDTVSSRPGRLGHHCPRRGSGVQRRLGSRTFRRAAGFGGPARRL